MAYTSQDLVDHIVDLSDGRSGVVIRATRKASGVLELTVHDAAPDVALGFLAFAEPHPRVKAAPYVVRVRDKTG